MKNKSKETKNEKLVSLTDCGILEQILGGSTDVEASCSRSGCSGTVSWNKTF